MPVGTSGCGKVFAFGEGILHPWIGGGGGGWRGLKGGGLFKTPEWGFSGPEFPESERGGGAGIYGGIMFGCWDISVLLSASFSMADVVLCCLAFNVMRRMSPTCRMEKAENLLSSIPKMLCSVPSSSCGRTAGAAG